MTGKTKRQLFYEFEKLQQELLGARRVLLAAQFETRNIERRIGEITKQFMEGLEVVSGKD